MRRSGLALLVLLAGAPALRAEDPPPPSAPAAEAPSATALAEQLASADVDARRKAAYALYGLGQAAAPALAALAKGMADPDDYVRTTSERALTRVAETPAIGQPDPWSAAFPVLKGLLEDARPAVRRSASVALWRMGPFPARAGDLTRVALALLADVDADLRANGAGILTNVAWTDRSKIAPVLDQAMLVLAARAKDEDDRVRCSVAETLGALMESKGFEALLVLAADADLRVRTTAIGSLAMVRPPSEEAAARRERILIESLRHPDQGQRLAAASALGADPSPATLEPLLAAARDESDPLTRAPALAALGQLGDLRALPTVRAAMDADATEVRQSAVSALASFGPEVAPYVPALIRLLDDAEVAPYAARTLGQLGHVGAVAIPALLRWAERSHARASAVAALHGFAPDGLLPATATPALLGLLPGPDRFTTDSLCQLLSAQRRLPAEAGPPLLLAYRSFREDDHRAAAVLAMTCVEPSSEELLAVFRAHAGNASPVARSASLGLILRGTDEDRARGLTSLLAAPAEEIDRANAHWLLGRAGPAAAAAGPSLEAELAAADQGTLGGRYLRLRLAAVLLRIGGPAAARATEILVAALRAGTTTGEARLAAEALGELPDPSHEVLDALVDRLDAAADDPFTAIEAARTLGRLGARETGVLDALVRAAETPRRGALRTAAATALVRLASR